MRRLLVSPRAVYTHKRRMLTNMKGAYFERTIPVPTYRRNPAVEKRRDVSGQHPDEGMVKKQTPAGPEGRQRGHASG